MFAEALLQHFSSTNNFKLVVVSGTKIKSYNFEENHRLTHEKAYTPSSPCIDSREWLGQSMCLVTRHRCIDNSPGSCFTRSSWVPTRLRFLTVKSTKYREIDVVGRVHAIGSLRSQGLIGLHNFTGADWGGKFVGISKKTWVGAYMKLDGSDPDVTCFRQHGDGIIPTELVDDDLHPQVKNLERFVCQAYSSTGETNLPTLRWQLFRSKNLAGEILPPTRAALLPHIKHEHNTLPCATSRMWPVPLTFLLLNKMAGGWIKECSGCACAVLLYLLLVLWLSWPNLDTKQVAQESLLSSFWTMLVTEGMHWHRILTSLRQARQPIDADWKVSVEIQAGTGTATTEEGWVRPLIARELQAHIQSVNRLEDPWKTRVDMPASSSTRVNQLQ